MWKDACVGICERTNPGAGVKIKWTRKLSSRDWTCARYYRVHFPDQDVNKVCTRLRWLHSSGFNSPIAVDSRVRRDLLPILLVLTHASTVLNAVTGSIRSPLSTKCCRIALFIVLTVPLQREAGTCSGIHFVMCPVHRALQEHVNWHNAKDWSAQGNTSLDCGTIGGLISDMTCRYAAGSYERL